MKVLLKTILLLALLAAGIGSFLFLTKYEAVQAGYGWTDGVALHGRFCGPGHPFVDRIGSDGERARLSSIQPLDSLDAACKAHDLCYIEQGYFDPGCDRAVASRLRVLADAFESRDHPDGPERDLLCAEAGRLMADYFLERESTASGVDAIRAWFADARELPVDLREAGPAFYRLYLDESTEPLRCEIQ